MPVDNWFEVVAERGFLSTFENWFELGTEGIFEVVAEKGFESIGGC